MKGPSIREAILSDGDFLASAIISAEKSGTERLGLAALCGLSEERLRPLLGSMLAEEVDGCEFSVSSFLIAEIDGQQAAAVAGWVEGFSDDVPSMILKANLLAFTFPAECLARLRSHSSAVKDLQIEREPGSLQIEYVHVDDAHRGSSSQGLVRKDRFPDSAQLHRGGSRNRPIPSAFGTATYGGNY
ncbi:MAG: hypothetical protein IPP33_03350 [Flavobacteriales bacterium]|nr:hypothetical protein [Flavobacteriales bacterium]